MLKRERFRDLNIKIKFLKPAAEIYALKPRIIQFFKNIDAFTNILFQNPIGL